MTLAACALVIFACCLIWDLSPLAFLLLIAVAIVVFPLSILFCYFISEPLRILAKKIEAYHSGINPSFEPTGRLYEADQLSQGYKHLTQTVQQQQHDLEIKEKRQAEFISDVAHELRTPLTAIRGNAEMLADPDLPPELHEKFCNIIINESERLSRLTHDLLDLQKIENDDTARDMKRINLRELAQGVVDALGPILHDRQANCVVTGEAPDVLGNPDQLKQALTNLVENASRFIEPGGHIEVQLFGMQGNSIIAVKDDGCGFGDVDPKLLFDRFYRTDASRCRGTGGTGLGLAIVKSIAEAHDGSVEAVNLPEGGACFIVAIPSVA